LEKVFPRDRYQQPKESVFKGSEADGNQNPFSFLDTLHYVGLPPPESYYKKKLKPPAMVPLVPSEHPHSTDVSMTAQTTDVVSL
jgi:hypothetical protein